MTPVVSWEFDPVERLSQKGAPLRLGVLGAARIVPKALSAALLSDDFPIRVVAIASRDASRATAVAEKFNIPHVHDSYQDLLARTDLDAVYVALPCSLHARWTEAALVEEKHVLCEKPFSLSIREAEHTLELARQRRRLVMEAHHWRYHELLPEVTLQIQKLGRLRLIETSFCAGIDDPEDIRKNPLLGAGVTMDFGCYALMWISWAATCGSVLSRAAETARVDIVSATMEEDAPGIDVVLRAELIVEDITARIHCDMRPKTPFSAPLRIEGEFGTVLFDTPLVAQGSYVRFEPNQEGQRRGLTATQKTASGNTTTYSAQLLAFYQALSTGLLPPTAGDGILHTQRLLDRVYEKAGVPSRSELSRRSRLIES